MISHADPSLWLVDTNVLLRLLNRDRPGGMVAERAVRILQDRDILVAFTLQNLTEFWNVSTRPVSSNSFGLSVEECDNSIRKLEPGFFFLADTESVYTEWRRLVFRHRVSGVQVHDARLAASMLAHGLTHILTFNTADFVRFDGITPVHPEELQGTRPDILKA